MKPETTNNRVRIEMIVKVDEIVEVTHFYVTEMETYNIRDKRPNSSSTQAAYSNRENRERKRKETWNI